MQFKKLLFCVFSMLASIGAFADEPDSLADERLLKEKHLLLESLVLNAAPTIKSVTAACLTLPLPKTPKTPNYSLTAQRFNGTLKLTFWRESCNDGAGSALLVRAVPVEGNPFLCGAELKVLQNSMQFNNIRLESTPDAGAAWCDDLFVPATFVVNQVNLGDAQYNPAKGLTVIYNDLKLEIPAGGVATPNVSGSAAGYRSYKLSCKNTRTGEVKSFPLQTGADWNCKGLSIKSGDTVKTTLTGVAK